MATIRDCFLVDVSVFDNLEIVYCSYLRHTQNQLKKYKPYYTKEAPSITDKVIYMSDIIMDLKKAFKKLRKIYIPPNIPKLVVDS